MSNDFVAEAKAIPSLNATQKQSLANFMKENPDFITVLSDHVDTFVQKLVENGGLSVDDSQLIAKLVCVTNFLFLYQLLIINY